MTLCNEFLQIALTYLCVRMCGNAKYFPRFAPALIAQEVQETTESYIVSIRLLHKKLVAVHRCHMETSLLQSQANMAEARESHRSIILARRINVHLKRIFLTLEALNVLR